MDIQKLQERFTREVFPRLQGFARWYYAEEDLQANFLGFGWYHYQRWQGQRSIGQLILECRSCVHQGRTLPGLRSHNAREPERRYKRCPLHTSERAVRENKDNPSRVAAERELFALVRECCTPTEQKVFDALCLDPRTGSGRLQRELTISIERVQAARACIHHYYLSLSGELPAAASEDSEQRR